VPNDIAPAMIAGRGDVRRTFGQVSDLAPGRGVRPGAPDPARPRRRRLVAALVVTVGLLLFVTAVHRLGPAHAGMIVGPLAAVALLVLGRRSGLTWEDIGLARRTWRRGLIWGLSAAALVAIVYAVAAVLPATRSAFLDARYHLPPATGLVTALVVVPIGTVLLEEVAFRGVILGLVRRHRGTLPGAGFSSALFGLWHVLPSLQLSTANPAIATVVGHGVAGQATAVAISVAFTAGAGLLFCELRRRSGSLLAGAGLHWATNGLGVVVAMLMWHA
jgi:membrane protease YdiL (CAAX protease family)